MKLQKTCILLLAMMMTLGVGAKTKAPKEKDMGAYLMVYHKDADHGLHMAVSYDGYHWKALNGDQPVVAADSIADQKGIRDPHIYRGPDGAFYLAMTDLHVFGQRAGVRTTQWERPDEYGWGNNRGLVLMKSTDLIHWTHHEVRLDQLFPDKLSDIGCAWAPETTFDPKAGKLMVYFTLRTVGENLGKGTPEQKKTRLFYAYADNDFTTFTSEPKLLYQYADPKVQVLDADITPMPRGGYCMTYVAQENPGGIKMAFSKKINGGYNYLPQQIDGENTGCEAPHIFKLIGQDKWILMYDIYSVQPHNFGFMETTDFKTFTPLGHFDAEGGAMHREGFSEQKHGAVCWLTKAEAQQLESHWQEQRRQNVQAVHDFLKAAGHYIISTVDGLRPQARPFGTQNIFDGQLEIQTGHVKAVDRQIQRNPRVCIVAMKGGEWMRINATLVEDTRMEAREAMLESMPQLKTMYKADDGNTAVYMLTQVEATNMATGHTYRW